MARVAALVGLLLALGFFLPARAQVVPSTAPYVILDDDAGDDIDNLADLRIFNTMAVNQQLFPLGLVLSTNEANGAPYGAIGRNFSKLGYPVYIEGGSTGGDAWVAAMVGAFAYGDQNSNYTAVTCEAGYRKLLAAAPKPVIVVMGGPATCMDELLESPSNYNGDGLGTGLSLIEAHVSYVIWAAGTWPSGTGDSNLGDDKTSSADLFANWPSSVPFYLYGVNLTTTAATGPFPSGVCETSASDPYQYGFYEYSSAANPCVRSFWTQPAFLIVQGGIGGVLAGSSPLFGVGGQGGSVTYNTGTTANTWSSSPGPFTYLTNVASQSTLQTDVCKLEETPGTNWC